MTNVSVKNNVFPRVDVKIRVTDLDLRGWKSLLLCSMTSAKMKTGRHVINKITTSSGVLTVEDEAE